MTRARIVIALAIAAAIAILVWQLATRDDGSGPPPGSSPNGLPPPVASSTSETLPDLPGATIVPRRAPEADGEAGPTSVNASLSPPKISVLVVDDAGAPQAKVLVALAEDGPHPGMSAATTGDDGTVGFTLSPLEQLTGAGKELPAGKSGIRVAVALPLDEPVVASFQREKVPESPIRLVLPATGRVIARLVTADGAPFTRDATAELQSMDDGSAPPVMERYGVRVAAIDGVATFPRVGKSSRLEVSATPDDPAHRKVMGYLDGPRTAAEASITLVCGGLATRITGRVVKSDAQPLPRANVTLSLPAAAEALKNDSAWSYQGRGMTGEDGRFSARFDVDPATITGKEARLAIDDGVTVPKRLTLTIPEAIRTGLADLGDVVVPDLDFVAAGEVVTGEGAALAGAYLVIMVRAPEGWRRNLSSEGKIRALTSKEGKFELRGKVEPQKTQLGLAAELDGWTCVDAVPFEVGARDVRITMLQGGSIEGSIAGLDQANSRYWVESPIGVAVVKAGKKRTLHFTPGLDMDWRPVNVLEGKFEARSLLSGTYSVEFHGKARRPGEFSESVLVVDDVVVRPGEVNRDPRLQNIPLAKLFKSRVVTVVDQDGRPLQDAQIGARPAGESGSFTNFTTGYDGKRLVVTSAAIVDLVVALKGYRAETVGNVTEDATVKLRKSSPKRVTLRLPDDVEIPPPPFYLGASLNWIGSSKPSDGFDQSDPRNRFAETVFFGADRTAIVEVDSPGTYAATVWLHERGASGGFGQSIADEKRATVEIGEDGGASVAVNVDQDALKSAIASRKK